MCHAYQILIKNGLHPDNIITFMYNDIANSPENPFKGQIFNKPTAQGTPGVDVYKGVQIDYEGKNVNKANFIKVITGDSSADGKVLKSGPDDRVFINFVDHGATGIIAFPSEEMDASELNKALHTMHDKKMYKELVFYLEACESGSMFNKQLPANIKIYATTASNPSESSWGTYCSPNDKVNGKSIGSCLGDLYSVSWMENTDASGATETLEQQFTTVKNLTNKSHVMQYGELDIDPEAVKAFLGESKSERVRTGAAPDAMMLSESSVDSRDIRLHNRYYAYLRANSTNRQARAAELMEEILSRQVVDATFEKMAAIHANGHPGVADAVLNGHTDPSDFACQRALIRAYKTHCGLLTDYALKYVRVLVNMCERGTRTLEQNQDAVRAACI